MLLHLGHVESSELGRGGALREQAHGGPLPQPLGQPGQVTVAVQAVGVEAAARTESDGVGVGGGRDGGVGGSGSDTRVQR